MSIWRSQEYHGYPLDPDIRDHRKAWVEWVLAARKRVRMDIAQAPISAIKDAAAAYGYSLMHEVFLDGLPELPPWPPEPSRAMRACQQIDKITLQRVPDEALLDEVARRGLRSREEEP